MKLKIKGEVNTENIGEAFQKALEYSGFDPTKHAIRGATVFFNIYDRSTGEAGCVVKDGEVIEEVVWITPEEKERQRQMAQARRTAKRKTLPPSDSTPD